MHVRTLKTPTLDARDKAIKAKCPMGKAIKKILDGQLPLDTDTDIRQPQQEERPTSVP